MICILKVAKGHNSVKKCRWSYGTCVLVLSALSDNALYL